jgi:hypothetical protein
MFAYLDLDIYELLDLGLFGQLYRLGQVIRSKKFLQVQLIDDDLVELFHGEAEFCGSGWMV